MPRQVVVLHGDAPAILGEVRDGEVDLPLVERLQQGIVLPLHHRHLHHGMDLVEGVDQLGQQQPPPVDRHPHPEPPPDAGADLCKVPEHAVVILLKGRGVL